MNETTRKYPRTISEAFPHTVEYGCSIEHHTPASSVVADCLVAVCLGVLGACWLFFWLSY